jgi:anti-anti-sigma factor
MTSFTSRYGDPAMEHHGAHLRAQRRHTATVVAITGRLGAANVDWAAEHVTRMIADDGPFVLDLGAVSAFSASAVGIIDALVEHCARARVSWALVAGPAVLRRIAGRPLPLVESVAAAEHAFDDAIGARRRRMLALLGRTA